MKSLKKCMPKIHKEFSIEKNKSYMRRLKNQNMILVFVILTKLSAAVAIDDCTRLVESQYGTFKCNSTDQVFDLSACNLQGMSALSISSCGNATTGYFGVKANGMMKFENIGILDIDVLLPSKLEKLEFISIDKIVNINRDSFIDIATLGLFRIDNSRIDKFDAVLNKTDITELKLTNVTIESLEAIDTTMNGISLTIIDCHFKRITGPLNFHKFEKIMIKHSIFIFSDFYNLSLTGNVIDVHNNSFVNASIRIDANRNAGVDHNCGLESSMHIKSDNVSSNDNYLQSEITYEPPTKRFRDNNQLCTKETCPCRYSNAGSIVTVSKILIFTVVCLLRYFSFEL